MRNGKSFSGFFHLPLVAGILLFAITTLILTKVSSDIIHREPLTVAEAQLNSWVRSHRSPSLTRAMLVVTSFGSTLTVTCIAVAMGLYLLWRRRFYWLAVVAAAVGGGGLLNRLLKYAFHRPRPDFDDPILALTSFSFPSGHTMAATVLYGVMAAYLIAKTPNWRWRLLIVFMAALLMALVGFSRIYLGAHYLSDVVAAMAEGLAWLMLCLTSVYSIWSLKNPHG